MTKTKHALAFFLFSTIVWVGASLTVVPGSSGMAAEREESGGEADPYPPGLELRVLARDLKSREYHEVLETMIPTDLAAEWERVATPDNYLTFLSEHGGKEKVLADPQLKAAYERRRQIAEQFLDLMRAAYKKRDQEPPFDEDDRVEPLLRNAAERAVSTDPLLSVPLRVVMPAPGAERQWPRFRGPTGQGTALDTDFPLTWSDTENVVWKTELPGEGSSSPVVWDDRLFVTAASEEGDQRLLLCYSRTDGRLLWKQEAPQPSSIEKLYWKNTYASSTPVTDGERVVVFFGNSGLVCYDMDGNRQWHQDLVDFTTTHGPGTSPVLYKDKVIFIQYQNRGESQFVGLDKQTGRKLWQHELPNAMCWSTPVVVRVGDRDELIYNSSHQVVGYDPDSGEELWRLEGSTREAIPTIVVGGGLIYSTSGRNGPTLAIRPGGNGDVTESHLFWQTQRGGPHVPSPAYYDGRLYMVNDTGIVTCLDAITGETIWQNRLRGRFSMSPIECGGKLLLTNEDGKTSILNAGTELEVLAENDLNQTTLATPAVLDGQIFFRTASHLLCIGESQ